MKIISPVKKNNRYQSSSRGMLDGTMAKNHGANNTPYPFFVSSALILYLIFIVLVILPFVIPTMSSTHRFWKGYYTLLVKDTSLSTDVASVDVTTMLKSDSKFEWVICSEDTEVVYNDITSLKKIGLLELKDRFDPLDPRYDQYMKRIPLFFQVQFEGDNWTVYYLRTDASPIRAYYTILKKLNGYGVTWRLVEFNLIGKIVALGHLAIFISLLCLWQLASDRAIVLVGIACAIPWCINILWGSTTDVIVAFAVSFMWFLFIADFIPYLKNLHLYDWQDTDLKQRVVRKFYIFFGLNIVLVIVMLSGKSIAITLRILSTFVAHCAFGGFVIFLTLIAGYKERILPPQRHLPFEPVGILRSLKPRIRTDIKRDIFPPLMLCVLASFFMFSYFCYPLRGCDIPKPYNLFGAGDFRWSSLERLWLNSESGALPDVSDFITHLSFQEGFSLGREYVFPTEEQEMTLSMYAYRAAERKIVKSERVVKVFDETWLKSRLGVIEAGTLERLFLDQQKPVMIALYRLSAFSTDISRWRLGAVVAVFIGLLITNFHLTPSRLYGMRSGLYESA